MHYQRLLWLWIAISSLAFLLSERAQADSATPKSARALEIGHDALELFEAGDFRSALAQFQAADKLAHSPVFVLYIARAHRELGQLLLARSEFQKLTSLPLDNAAPEVWKASMRDAALELEALERRIPSLRIVVSGSPLFPLRLAAGERVLDIASEESVVEFDPGRHALSVTDARGKQLRYSIELTEGEKQRSIEFDFRSRVTAPKPILPAKARPRARKRHTVPPPLRARDRTGERETSWGALTALGLGSTAIAFGAMAGLVALTKANEVKNNCIDSRCLAEDRDKGESARQFGDLATIGFTVGAVGVGAGVVLLLWQPERSPAVRARIQTNEISVSGRF